MYKFYIFLPHHQIHLSLRYDFCMFYVFVLFVNALIYHIKMKLHIYSNQCNHMIINEILLHGNICKFIN